MSDETTGAAMSPQDLALAAAIRRYEERLSKDPASLGFALLADLYRKAGRVDEAVATCREGLGRHPHYATARLILAKALVGRQDFTEALSEIDTILRVNPKDVQCHRLAAEMYRRLGRLDDAVQHLERAATLDPAERESHTLLGLLRAEGPVGDPAVARQLADAPFVPDALGTAALEQGWPE